MPVRSKKIDKANPAAPSANANATPHPLPPSVEEAYRRKCCQLRHRTKEVETANDAARVRLHRLKRQVEKLRVERAFLLEQLAKRTSTNVEDSEGSPSPPPSPKEKPLRTKRGHRKPSILADLDNKNAGASFLSVGQTVSPTSESFVADGKDSSSRANGVAKPKRPSNAFELYCTEMRPVLKAKNKGDSNMEEDLARGWKDLDDNEREEYSARYEQDLAKYQKDKESYSKKSKEEAKAEKERGREREREDQRGETEPEGDAEQEADQEPEPEPEAEADADIKSEADADDMDADVKSEADADGREPQDDDVEMVDDGEETEKA